MRGCEPPRWAQLQGWVLSDLVLSPGLAGPLRWLENCLRRVAGDREEDGEWGRGRVGVGSGGLGGSDSTPDPGVSHPVPLVPLTEENEDAMEDRRFQSLLRQLGLRPPASEQVRSLSPSSSSSPSLSPSPCSL